MKIKDYKEYGVIDFVEDDRFRRWVVRRDDSLSFFWNAYIREYPHKINDVNVARQIILGTTAYYDNELKKIDDPNDDFACKLQAVFEKSEKDSTRKGDVKFKPILTRIKKLSIAACLAVIIFSGFYFLQFNRDDTIEYTTRNGEWMELTLPDGSRVELNANSRLSMNKDWKGNEDRLVWLRGEAFFEVTKKPSTNAKFIVVTKDLEVEVLGTSFSVNTRNLRTEVFLEEGEITLNLDNQKEIIVPGEFISYSQGEKQIINRYKKEEEIHSNWKDGVLKIDDATVKHIFNEIESIYGIDLIIKNENLLKKEGSVTIPVDDLRLAISILERVLNVQIEKRGMQYFIK